MYNIGDKVVYPMHGAGSIVSIEEKEVMGKNCKRTWNKRCYRKNRGR